jgi:hypothetical protein
MCDTGTPDDICSIRLKKLRCSVKVVNQLLFQLTFQPFFDFCQRFSKYNLKIIRSHGKGDYGFCEQTSCTVQGDKGIGISQKAANDASRQNIKKSIARRRKTKKCKKPEFSIATKEGAM